MPSPAPTLRAPVTAALAGLLAAFATGCGEGPATARPDGRFGVALHDYYLAPQRVVVPAGRLRVTVRNDGRIAHSFRIATGREETDAQVLKVAALKPGQTVTRSFRLAAGRYVMFCAIGNHEELGMRGTVVVQR